MLTLNAYCQSVVSRVNEATEYELENDVKKEGYSVLDIATILAVVIPALNLLPCLNKDGDDLESRKAIVERHPNLAIARTAQEIRKQAKQTGEKTTRKHSKLLATEIVNDFLSSSEEEIDSILG